MRFTTLATSSAAETSIHAPALLFDEIIDHLRDQLPAEGCGLIGGVRLGATYRARTYYPGTNIDHSERRFTMHPREVIDAFRSMRDAGEELVGIVHSHPDSAPAPSDTDLREWHYPEAVMLILSFAEEVPVLGGWIIRQTGCRRSIRPAAILPLLSQHRK
jgi:proteasome lid subunit RPN8/RPN11